MKINNLDLKKVRFLRRDVLKSNFKKFAPFDVIIIDPPSFQKGSFEASKDYIKIIKKLKDISHNNTTLIACVNSPKITKEDLTRIVEKNSNFKYKEEIIPPKEYVNSTLKSLIFSG